MLTTVWSDVLFVLFLKKFITATVRWRGYLATKLSVCVCMCIYMMVWIWRRFHWHIHTLGVVELVTLLFIVCFQVSAFLSLVAFCHRMPCNLWQVCSVTLFVWQAGRIISQSFYIYMIDWVLLKWQGFGLALYVLPLNWGRTTGMFYYWGFWCISIVWTKKYL